MRFATIVGLVAVGASVACGDSSGNPLVIPYPTVDGSLGTPDVSIGVDVSSGPDTGGPSDQYPAPHPALPTVLNMGGPLMTSPTLVAVTYNVDPFRAELEPFVSAIAGSTYLKLNAGEYTTGAAAVGAPVHLSEAAPATIDDTGVSAWLAGKLNAHDPAFGVPTANTLYLLFYPDGTSVTLMGSVACKDIGAYHESVKLSSGIVVPYAVIPRCMMFNGLSGIDETTGAASHEILEAVTDPQPTGSSAYSRVDDANFGWMLALGGGEIGDLCAADRQAFFRPASLNYNVQRTWSNRAARGGHDPCVPALPNEVFFYSSPVLDEMVPLQYLTQTFSANCVHIAVGQSKTVDVDLWSDGPTSGPWQVKAFDIAMAMGLPEELAFTWDQTSGQNGQVLHLTIDVLMADPTSLEGFAVASVLGSSGHVWGGIVATP